MAATFTTMGDNSSVVSNGNSSTSSTRPKMIPKSTNSSSNYHLKPRQNALSWSSFFQGIVVIIVIMKLIQEPKNLGISQIGALESGLGSLTSTGDDNNNYNSRKQGIQISFQNQHPVCQRLGGGGGFLFGGENITDNKILTNRTKNPLPLSPLSTESIWTHYLEEIAQASVLTERRRRNITEETELQNYNYNMLLDLTPNLLQRGLMVPPRSTDIQRILDILFIEQRPLKVLVMGGSVTEGVGCHQSERISGRSCNWSVRLEQLLNRLLGFNAVEISNIAQGGTHTAQGMSLIKYWMYPDSLAGKQPDIIIHAFGSNDSHLGGQPETENARVMELFKQGLERLSWFTETVHKAHPCTSPIILHLDEYVGGHSQGAIIGDVVYRMVLQQVAGWYQNMAVSSARVLAPLIYPGTKKEKVFSPEWKPNFRNNGKFRENCHFGWQGHQAVAWTFSYAFLDTIVHFCHEQDWAELYKNKEENLGNLRESVTTIEAKELKDVPPPPLQMGLTVEDVSTVWREHAKLQEELCKTTEADAKPCLMAWIAGPEGPTSNAIKLQNFLEPFIKDMKGWSIEADMSHGWSRKLGIVANGVNATMVFHFANVTQSPTLLTMQTIKSYGEKWAGSLANIAVEVQKHSSSQNSDAHEKNWTRVLDENIEGSHTSTSSCASLNQALLCTLRDPRLN